MENETERNNDGFHSARIVLFSCYSLFGSVAIFVNFLILVALLRCRELRRRHILQIALAGGDFLQGCGYVIAGSMRIAYIREGVSHSNVTRLECAGRIFTPLLIVGTDIPAVMDLVISIDRFLAIVHPIRYHIGPRIKCQLIAVALAYSISLLAAGFVFLVASTDPTVTDDYLCSTLTTEGPAYAAFDYGFVLVFSTSACALYAITIGVMRSKNRRIRTEGFAMRRFEQQKRMTQMMAAVVCLSCCFYIFPKSALLVLEMTGARREIFAPALAVVMSVHSTVNIIVYSVRSKEMRTAFLNTLSMRSYPFTVEKLKASKVNSGATVNRKSSSQLVRAQQQFVPTPVAEKSIESEKPILVPCTLRPQGNLADRLDSTLA